MKKALFLAMNVIICPGFFAACRSTQGSKAASTMLVDDSRRVAYIKQAEVWIPNSDQTIKDKNLMLGPTSKYIQQPAQELECDFAEPDPQDPPGGRTPKFDCNFNFDGKIKKFKVKYDSAKHLVNGKASKPNLEVYGEILSTRLLWSLGFLADNMYTVRVKCKGCPLDPWTYVRKKSGILDKTDEAIGFIHPELLKNDDWQKKADQRFEPAVIEIKYEGDKIETAESSGWGWSELYDYMDHPEQQKLHRDALTIVAALINHMDNKAEQQRMVCFSKDDLVGDKCQRPFLMIQDAGSSFGNGWAPLQGDFTLNKLDLDKWVKLNLWSDLKKCSVQVHGALNGSFRTTWTVTEESRAFVAGLFAKLSDQQMHDLFAASQIDSITKNSSKEAWVEGFKTKVKRDIMDARCG